MHELEFYQFSPVFFQVYIDHYYNDSVYNMTLPYKIHYRIS